MKLLKKALFTFSIVSIISITIISAQELTKQSISSKIKNFIKTTSIEIMEEYIEDNIKVYKVYDSINDKYYKLALDNNNTINWYDNVKYKDVSKIDTSLKQLMNELSDDEKIPVIVELSFDYESVNRELSSIQSNYFTREGLKSNLSNQEISKAKEIKKEYVKEVMLKNNKLDSKYEVLAVSQYSPFVFLNVTKDEIETLEKSNKVYSIGLFPAEFEQNEKLSEETITAAINNNAINVTRTNIVKNAGVTGNGVKIGQIENSNPNTSNSYLVGKSIIKRTTNCNSSDATVTHATEVAGILVGNNGIAPNATLYSACYSGSTEEDIITSFSSAIDWLVSQNVDIINMSAWAQEGGTYNVVDRFVDAITYINDILFVKSAGNNDPINEVSSPGLSFNAITVGSISYTGSDYEEAMASSRSSFSRYNKYSNNNQSNKPELVAPGQNVNYTNSYGSQTSGTSFSSPVVAGATALLMEGTPSVKNDFRAVKAALFATARPMNNYGKTVSNNDNGWLKTYRQYNNEVGLGILDTKSAYDLLRWNQFKNVTVNGGSSDSYTFNNTLGNGMDVRVAITWSKPNTLLNFATTSNRVADLDLQIIGPNGEQVARSISSYDNVEWVNFITSQGYGTYQFKIINYDSHGNSVPTKVSMAWW